MSATLETGVAGCHPASVPDYLPKPALCALQLPRLQVVGARQLAPCVALGRAAQPILVISDELYNAFVYDGCRQPPVAAHIANTAICSSWSKSLGLPGERIGYLALSPLHSRICPRVPFRPQPCIQLKGIVGRE